MRLRVIYTIFTRISILIVDRFEIGISGQQWVRRDNYGATKPPIAPPKSVLSETNLAAGPGVAIRDAYRLKGDLE
jgi:hypothetical protein